MVLTCEICDELIRCEEMIKVLFDKQLSQAASKRRRLKLIKPSSSARLNRVSCNECQKLFKNSRSLLSTHKSYYHRNKAANVEAKVETKVETKIEAKVNATTEQLQ